MAKHYTKKRNLKYVFLAFACAASFTMTGLATACNNETNTPDDDEETVTTTKEDNQLLKNGNFEFFNVPEKQEDGNEPVYLINSPNNWTGGSTSSAKSGILNTSETAWNILDAEDFADTLDYNNGLDTSASNYKELYVDYNGLKSSDLLYKDTYAALKMNDIEDVEKYFGITKNGNDYYMGDTKIYAKTEGEGDKAETTFYLDEDLTKPIEKARISNPGTHYNVHKKDDGKTYYYDETGAEKELYVDEKGDYYLGYNSDTDEYTQPISNVLMLHNYSASNHNGISQSYSSVSITLPANTAVEISVWVKTSNLLFAGGKNVSQDRGAFINVSHTIGGNSLSDLAITNINTEKLISQKNAPDSYNGWVQYTIFVNACDFASTNVSLALGLGDSQYNVEGYAFFDDITVKQYSDISDSPYGDIPTTTPVGICTLDSDDSEKTFIADTFQRETAGGIYEEKRYSDTFTYLLDLSSVREYTPVNFGSDTTVNAGLTVDSDNYVSSLLYGDINRLGYTTLKPVASDAKLSEALKNIVVGNTNGNGLDTSKDFLAKVSANTEFVANNTEYYKNLNDAVSSAKDLPKMDKFGSGDENMLVMLSAYGAAYTTSFELEIDNDTNNMLSFWVKTSDMGGQTAGTVTITEKGNKSNTASISIDSTNVKTEIEDNEDVYNGWVQCFLFIDNELEFKRGEAETTTVKIEFSFGNTSLKSAEITSYKAGWAALANMQILKDVDEKIFGYATSGDYSASFNITGDEDKLNEVFDEVYGSLSHEIETGLVRPSNYSGVNGGSSTVLSGTVNLPFDNTNDNEYAGLINSKYFENYEDYNYEWYTKLLESFKASGYEALAAWSHIFGTKCVQPLIIVNETRNAYLIYQEANESNYELYYIKDEDGEFVSAKDTEYSEDETYYSLSSILNYGYIGSNKTVSANSYATVSVRVKASAGAKAYVYLVDTSADKDILGFNAPSFTFYYDNDGNVLKAEADEDATPSEKRENLLYTKRDDGLYEDTEGNLYANTWNLIKSYKDETASYYDSEGNRINFNKLVNGETYYTSPEHNVIANHYLQTSDGTKVYEYKNGNYYYIVEGKTQTTVINPFDVKYARYDYSKLNESYVQVIDGDETKGEWVTVTFVLHAGSEAKSYRLELWSGERNSTNSGQKIGSSVIFDYSYTSISDDTLKGEYESDIIQAYQEILTAHNIKFATSNENIAYYEDLVKKNNISESEIASYEILKNYTAHYYTYSFYDSNTFVPFNAEVADENTLGYDYTVSDNTESLIYLSVNDGNERFVFADYTQVDQSISLDTIEEEEEEEEEETENNTNVWLLASSIVLVICLILAILALMLKKVLKNKKHSKVLANNKYNQKKTARYLKKLHITKEEFEEIEKTENGAETSEQPDDTVSTEETTESVEEVEPAETDESEENTETQSEDKDNGENE